EPEEVLQLKHIASPYRLVMATKPNFVKLLRADSATVSRDPATTRSPPASFCKKSRPEPSKDLQPARMIKPSPTVQATDFIRDMAPPPISRSRSGRPSTRRHLKRADYSVAGML